MSISLNGTTSFATIATTMGGLTHNVPKSICCWMKPSSNTVEQTVITQIDSGGTGIGDLGINLTSSGTVQGFANGGLATAFGAYANGGVWYFAYGCRTGSNFSDEYGIATSGSGFASDGVFTTQGGNVISTAATAWANFQIGKRGSAGKFFAGEICCVRTFSAKLTKAEFRLEAVNALARHANVIADWRLANATDLTSGIFGLAGTALTTGASEPTDILGIATAPLAAASYYYAA